MTTPASQIPPSIPAHIREQDKLIWRDWMNDRNVSDVNTKRTYVRHLSGFYEYCEKPIRDAATTDIDIYEGYLRESGLAQATIKHTMNTVKNYWRYARAQEEVSNGIIK